MSIVQRLLETRRLERQAPHDDVVIEQMRKRDLREVLAIENQVYPKPWTPGVFQSEIDEMRSGYRNYVVARSGGRLIGYAGLLYSGDDAHVTNIAVDPTVQRRQLATRLLIHQARFAIRQGFRNLTLEVRASNRAGQELYRRFGFVPAGIRKNYYEGVEDAIVMWCHDIDGEGYSERLRSLEAGIAR